MMLKSLLIILNLLSINAFCQNKSQVDIQYVDLKSIVVSDEIKKLISEEINSDDPEHLFKRGFGYVTLSVSEFSNSDTLYSCYISPSFYDIKKNALDNKYPIFYTYVSNRLVLIYLKVLDCSIVQLNISPKSKALIRRKINQFLEKKIHKTFYDSFGNVAFKDKNFRLDRFRFDAGKYIIIMKNGDIMIQNEKGIR